MSWSAGLLSVDFACFPGACLRLCKSVWMSVFCVRPVMDCYLDKYTPCELEYTPDPDPETNRLWLD